MQVFVFIKDKRVFQYDDNAVPRIGDTFVVQLPYTSASGQTTYEAARKVVDVIWHHGFGTPSVSVHLEVF